jgi:ribosome-binding ATPase
MGGGGVVLYVVSAVGRLQLLTGVKMLYAANVADSELASGNQFVEQVKAVAQQEGASVVVVSAQVRQEQDQAQAQAGSTLMVSSLLCVCVGL